MTPPSSPSTRWPTRLLCLSLLALSAAAYGCGSSSNGDHPDEDAGVEAQDGSADTFVPSSSNDAGAARDTGASDATAPDDVTVSPLPPDDGGHPLDAGADGAVDAEIDAGFDAGFQSAKHTLPQVTNNGGPVFSAPLLVTITYQGDTERTWAEGIGSYLVTSPWLKAVGPEYGIGVGTHYPLELSQTAPQTTDDLTIQALIASLIQDGTAPVPDGGATVPTIPASFAGGSDDGGATAAVMPPAIYMIYLPSTTSELVGGAALCDVSGGGYHGQYYGTVNGLTFAYAVVTQCPGAQQTDLEQAVSHEFIEAATDPALTEPAWSITDPNSDWYQFGGEVGDLCSFIAPQWAESTYTGIQRVYSNASAAAGGDPCLPSATTYYSTDQGPQTFISMKAGTSKTITVTGWSTGPLAPWTVYAEDYISSGGSTADGGDGTWLTSPSLAAQTLGNGDTTTLTFSVPADTPSGAQALFAVGSAESQTAYTATLVGVMVE